MVAGDDGVACVFDDEYANLYRTSNQAWLTQYHLVWVEYNLTSAHQGFFKGIVCHFFLSFKSHILDSNGVVDDGFAADDADWPNITGCEWNITSAQPTKAFDENKTAVFIFKCNFVLCALHPFQEWKEKLRVSIETKVLHFSWLSIGSLVFCKVPEKGGEKLKLGVSPQSGERCKGRWSRLRFLAQKPALQEITKERFNF